VPCGRSEGGRPQAIPSATLEAFPNACEKDLDEAVTEAIVDFLVDRIAAAGGFAPEDPAAG
jgi:hypothetical protein